MFQRLLICTNFVDGLQRLAYSVPSFASAGVLQITFLHCVPVNEKGAIPRVDTEKISQARSQLAAAHEFPESEIEVQVIVQSGRTADLILKTAKNYRSDLILLGSPVRSALAENLFGSTSQTIYDRTTIPLLTLRRPLLVVYTSEELDLRCRHLFRNLMLPYDGTPTAQALIEQVKRRLGQGGALQRLYLCWVLDAVERRDIPQAPMIKAAQDSLALVKADLEAYGLQVEIEVCKGEAVSEVLNAAFGKDVSAIALSTRSRNKLLEISAPGFAQAMLKQSWYPILFFPPT